MSQQECTSYWVELHKCSVRSIYRNRTKLSKKYREGKGEKKWQITCLDLCHLLILCIEMNKFSMQKFELKIFQIFERGAKGEVHILNMWYNHSTKFESCSIDTFLSFRLHKLCQRSRAATRPAVNVGHARNKR